MESKLVDREWRKAMSLSREGVVWFPAVGGKHLQCPLQRPTETGPEEDCQDTSAELFFLTFLL